MEKGISVIIPVRDNSKNNNKDLVYALRSIEMNLKGIGDIFIVGKKIIGLRGLKYISCSDEPTGKKKEKNIYQKILAAISHLEVTEDFCFLNDDHYLLQEFDVNSLPFYHKGSLEDTMAKNLGDYRKSVNHTRKYLLSKDKPTTDFDTHFPILYNKNDFCTFVCNKELNWDQPFGYVIKSLYANLKGIEGEFGGDCKVQKSMSYDEIVAKIGDKKFFSTSDRCMNADMMKFLEEKYPNKSRYER